MVGLLLLIISASVSVIYLVVYLSIKDLANNISAQDYDIVALLNHILLYKAPIIVIFVIICIISLLLSVRYVAKIHDKKAYFVYFASLSLIIGMAVFTALELNSYKNEQVNIAIQNVVNQELQKEAVKYLNDKLGEEFKKQYDSYSPEKKKDFVKRNSQTIEETIKSIKSGDLGVAKRELGDEKVNKVVEDGKKSWKEIFATQLDNALSQLSDTEKSQLESSFKMSLPQIRQLAINGDLKAAAQLVGKKQVNKIIRSYGLDPNSYLVRLVLG